MLPLFKLLYPPLERGGGGGGGDEVDDDCEPHLDRHKAVHRQPLIRYICFFVFVLYLFMKCIQWVRFHSSLLWSVLFVVEVLCSNEKYAMVC